MYDLFQNKKCICLELKTPQQLAEYSKIAYELWKSQTFMCNVLTKSITKKCKKTLLKKILNGWKRMENWTYEHKNFMLILYKGSLHKNAKLYWLLKQLDIPIIKYDKSKVKEHMEYANKRFYEICIDICFEVLSEIYFAVKSAMLQVQAYLFGVCASCRRKVRFF